LEYFFKIVLLDLITLLFSNLFSCGLPQISLNNYIQNYVILFLFLKLPLTRNESKHYLPQFVVFIGKKEVSELVNVEDNLQKT
jgi:hypothetical protein